MHPNPEKAATIFVVDDDVGMLRLIQKGLRREGYGTWAASSGKEAIEWLSGNRADLMLLDLKLQDIEGKELIKHLDVIGRTIPFIIITGQGDERVAVEMMKQGAMDYLVKDIQFLDFVPTVVERALRQIEQQRRLVTAEEELRNFEKRFSTVFRVSPVAISISRIETGEFVEVNDAWLKTLGYAREEAIGKTSVDLRFWASIQERENMLAELKSKGELRDFELQFVRKDGSKGWLLLSSEIIEFGGGKYILGLGMDITERKRNEARLQQQAQMLDLSHDAILMWRGKGIIDSWNKGATELYGYEAEEAIGRVSHKLLKTVCPVSWAEIEGELKARSFWEGEFNHTTKGGREVVVSSRLQRIPATGEELCIQGSCCLKQCGVERKLLLQALFAALEGLFSFHPAGHVLRRNQNASHLALFAIPGPHFPFEPLGLSIPNIGILLFPQHFSRQRTLVDCLPAFGEVWKQFIMRAPNNVVPQSIILTPQVARSQIAHLPIKHSKACWRVLDKKPQHPFGAFPIRNVAIALLDRGD